MNIYDYSNLLTVIDELDVEKAKLINKKEMNEKNRLIDLENELNNSGMLEDWKGLIEAMKKAGVRGCPCPNRLPGMAQFGDNYRFVYRVNGGSSGYREDYFALTIEDKHIKTSKKFGYCKWSTGYGSERQIDIFAEYGQNPEMHKVRVKTTLIKEFMENYPKYREFKLKEIYEAIGKRAEKVQELRKEIK
jgi:hypothetical protein